MIKRYTNRRIPYFTTLPITEAPNTGWVGYIGDFRQITRYNSKTSTLTERPPLFAARLP